VPPNRPVPAAGCPVLVGAAAPNAVHVFTNFTFNETRTTRYPAKMADIVVALPAI